MFDFTKVKVALAPLAGVSDYSFRKICADHGMKYSVTEMISAKAVHYRDKKTADLAYIRESEPDTAVQIFGSEPEIMAEAANLIASGTYAHNLGSKEPIAIDINMGCPVNKVVSNREGSALMKNPELAGKIIKAVVDAQKLPVTVKIRAGWDSNSINAVELAKIAEANGASMICVHGRTREDMYGPNVRLDVIKDVKASVSVPVLANGGIMNADDAVQTLDYTGADGVMIARGAMGNPWIFEEIEAKLAGRAYTYPELEERVATALEHVKLLIKEKGDVTGVREARKHVSSYTSGVVGGANARGKINFANSYEEFAEILNGLL